jgi:hypothetical protein
VVAVEIVPSTAVAQGAAPSTRFTSGSTVSDPRALFSHDGNFTVNLSYNTITGADGPTLYCFTAPEGTESPTFHVHLGAITRSQTKRTACRSRTRAARSGCDFKMGIANKRSLRRANSSVTEKGV